MRIERHIFGSYSGYTTLARSPGITPDDCRTLESGAYSYGQSNDRQFLKSLAKTPAYFTRVLTGGRRGLTRVLQGNPDDNDRPTVCLITLVLSQRDWDGELWGDVDLLLNDRSLWEWDGSTTLPAIDFAPPASARAVARKSVGRVLALVSEVEKAVAARRTIIVSPDDFSQADLRAVEMLVPPAARSRFTSGYRTLSGQLPVTVNCVASESAAQARATFRYHPGVNHLSPYATFLQTAGLQSGDIPTQDVASYRQFAAAEALAATAVPTSTPTATSRLTSAPVAPRPSTTPLVITSVAGLALATAAFFVGRSIGTSETASAEQAKQQQERLRLEQERGAAVAAATFEQVRKHEDKVRSALGAGGQTFDEMLADTKARLAAATAGNQEAAKKLGDENAKLREFYDAEHSRHRERAKRLQAAVTEIAKELDPRSLPVAQRRVAALQAELKDVRDQWPWPDKDDASWLADLKEARAQVEELAAAIPAMTRVAQILDECEEDIRRFNPETARDGISNVRAGAEQLRGELRSLPDKLPKSGIKLDEFKRDCVERAKAVKDWLAKKEAPPPDPKGHDQKGKGEKGREGNGNKKGGNP